MVSSRLQAEVVAALFRNVSWAVLGAAAGAVCLAYILARLAIAPAGRSAAWAAVIASGAAGHLLLRRAYGRSRPDEGRLDRWATAFTAVCLVEGLGWGYATVLLVDGGHFAGLMMTVAVALAVVGASVPAFSAHLPALAAFMLPVTLPYAVVSLFSSIALQQATSPLMALYIVGVGGLGVMANRSFREVVALRIRTSDLAEDLRAQKEIAEQASLAKSTFLAAASHDLRQPMHALGLFVGALRSMELPSEGQALVVQIEASVGAMDTLFGALLDISRLDAGVVEARPLPFAIQPLLTRICRDFTGEAEDKGLVLVQHPCRAVVNTDPLLLERIVRNLVSNAIRYTGSGRVVVGCRRRAGALSVEVWDTGPGIPADMRQRVFQEYFQLENPERDRSKGLGLGLAIVRRLAALIQGELTLRSEVGRGSCFSLRVGRVMGATVAEPAALAAPAGALARRLVVVIDDELAIREAMTAVLGGWGHETVAAASAAGGAGAARRPCRAAGYRHLRLPPARRGDRHRRHRQGPARLRRSDPGHADHRGHRARPAGGGAGERPSALAQACAERPAARRHRQSRLRAGRPRSGRSRGRLTRRPPRSASRDQIRPSARATRAAWVRFTTFRARKMAVTCTFTVFSDKPSCRAMLLFELPSLRSRRTSTCRSVSSDAAAGRPWA